MPGNFPKGNSDPHMQGLRIKSVKFIYIRTTLLSYKQFENQIPVQDRGNTGQRTRQTSKPGLLEDFEVLVITGEMYAN
jgi:hypothetical protein